MEAMCQTASLQPGLITEPGFCRALTFPAQSGPAQLGIEAQLGAWSDRRVRSTGLGWIGILRQTAHPRGAILPFGAAIGGVLRQDPHFRETALECGESTRRPRPAPRSAPPTPAKSIPTQSWPSFPATGRPPHNSLAGPKAPPFRCARCAIIRRPRNFGKYLNLYRIERLRTANFSAIRLANAVRVCSLAWQTSPEPRSSRPWHAAAMSGRGEFPAMGSRCYFPAMQMSGRALGQNAPGSAGNASPPGRERATLPARFEFSGHADRMHARRPTGAARPAQSTVKMSKKRRPDCNPCNAPQQRSARGAVANSTPHP